MSLWSTVIALLDKLAARLRLRETRAATSVEYVVLATGIILTAFAAFSLFADKLEAFYSAMTAHFFE